MFILNELNEILFRLPAKMSPIVPYHFAEGPTDLLTHSSMLIKPGFLSQTFRNPSAVVESRISRISTATCAVGYNQSGPSYISG